MIAAPILRKSQNYRLWRAGAFGNKLRAWRTLEEWRSSDYQELVTLRCLLDSGGGPCAYDVKPENVDAVVAEWLRRGIPLAAIMLNEGAPNDAILLQGEYYNGAFEDGSWDVLYHSLVKLKMRDALASSAWTVSGIAAREILRQHMTPASYDDWQEILERYPDHVIEVSIFDQCLGDLPHRNALVWEVRRY